MNICTIIAKNYVSHARVLADSFHAEHPGGTCSVLVVDDLDGLIDPAEEPFELLAIDEIGLPDPERMAAIYDVIEFSTAVKPWLMRHLLAADGVEAVTYLDPDIWIADSIEKVDALAREHGIVLTPHFTDPLPRDGLRPSEEDILIAGAYNLGFIALGAGETAERLLDWWSERLERNCVIEPGKGRFVDQRWIDLVPGIWPSASILRDPGFNIAYWNLPTRQLELDGERYVVDGEPLRFFHFSGFDPQLPGQLSKHQDRIEVARDPALTRICERYAEALLAHGYRETRQWSYGWDVLPNGIKLDRAARSVFRQAVDEDRLRHSVFSRRGAGRFVDHLNQAPGGNGGVSRYGRAIHGSRPDLRGAFPDLDGRDAPRFNRWMYENADTLGISRHLLPSKKATAREQPPASAGPARPEAASFNGKLGVNLAGYLDSELGVGEAARQVRSALAARDVPTASIEVPVDASRMPRALGRLGESELPYDFNLICVNADMLPSLAEASSEGFFDGRHSAGLWFWEVEDFPQRWHGSFEYLDEVWAASEFVAEALRPHSPIPVTTVRIPVTPEDPEPLNGDVSLPDGFRFLFVFDYRSVFRRKNPLGLIDAFSRSFEPGDGASLVIKSVGGESFPEHVARLEKAADAHPDVHLVDGMLSPSQKNGLISSCDAYVSLHRSEGLGLTMAEAMYFGKPVIATAYSGNLDFMTEENSYPIDYRLAKIGEDAGPYSPSGQWAEPDLAQASERMREVFEDRKGAGGKGERAAEDIRASHSPAAAGKLLEARLVDIRRQRVLTRLKVSPAAPTVEPGAGGPGSGESTGDASAALVPAPTAEPPDPTSGRAQLHHLLRFEEAPPRRGAGRLRRLAKRAYMRLLRPYASHQHRIDLSTRQAFDELGGELTALERRSAKMTEEAAADLEGELAALRSSLERTAAELREQADETAPEIAALDEAIEDALEESRSSIAGIRDSIDAVDDRVGELAGGERELRTAIEAGKEGLGRALAMAEALGERMTAELAGSAEHRAIARQQLEATNAEVAELKAALEDLSTQTDASLERDRVFVDALRQAHERFATKTEEAVAEVRAELAETRERSREVAAWSEADAAAPFMTDDRFAPRDDPRLGTVIGFAGKPGEAGGDSDFEDLFRGSEQVIGERQSAYVPMVAEHAPVLDAGCGRGEFLTLLSEAGIEALGVDLDARMVERCRERGLDNVELGDALEVLEKAAEESLGCVFSAQVVEHMEAEELRRLLALGRSRLRPGGLMIVETINPHSPQALKTFWVDPTHRRPLFPEALLALFEIAGFESASAFCPLGDGDWARDRLVEGEYAIVARVPAS